MQESSELIMGKANTLVQSLSDEIRDNLCGVQKKTRQAAVNAILGGLNPQENPEDSNILQYLPLALIESQEHIGALYFLQICIENSGYFDPRVIDAVIQSVARERTLCIADGDIEASETINTILKRLYNLILVHPEYKKTPEIYLSIGNDQEANKDTMGAIMLYNEACGLGSIESYIYLGNAYESKSMYDMSTNIFSIAYQLSGEIRFLHRLTRALCKSGKREEAYQRYLELQKRSKVPMNPFIVYLEDIHHDNDLDEFSELVTQYHLEGSFEPTAILTSLASTSSVYIANEIEKESSITQALNDVSLDVWTEEHDSEYWRSISRRLYLMQTHIITLADPRYLELYIDEMQRYTIDGNVGTQEMIRRFFTDSFSPYVLASYRQISIDTAIADVGEEGALDRDMRESLRSEVQGLQNIVPTELYESMRLHLIQMSAMFSQFSFYDIIRDQIIPFIESCLRQEGLLDEESEDSNRENIQQLRNEFSEYESYSPVTRKFYEEYIEFFDKKYGMFYRRHIQLLARDELRVPSSLRSEYDRVLIQTDGDHEFTRDIVFSNMRVFLDYPDVALLYLIEKIIVGKDVIGEDETIDMVVEKYQLHTLIERDAILLATLLYETGEYDDAIEYLMSIPDMLDVPQVLSMLTEWLRYLDDAIYPKALKSLNRLVKSEYDAKNSFEQVKIIADDIINSDDASDSDKAHMHMAIAHVKTIRGKDVHEIQTGFNIAGNYGLSHGYIANGDILRESGDMDEAIVQFKNAYLSQPDIVSICRLIGCLVEAARFYEAQVYIDIALSENYDISGFIFAWHLYQGHTRLAIEQMVRMLQADGLMDMTMPENCMESLNVTISQLLSDTTNTRDIDGLKILASHINISMATDSDELDPADFIVHMDYIQALMNTYEGGDLINTLYHTMTILISDTNHDDKKNTIDTLTLLLQIHFLQMHDILAKIHVRNQNQKNVEGARSSFAIINELTWRALEILQRFPDTEVYLSIWRDGLNFSSIKGYLDDTIHNMPETVQ